MSLKRMVIGMAIGFAAREGIGAMRRSGGLSGLTRKISQAASGRGGSGGGIGSMLRGGGGMGGGLGGAGGMGGGAGLGGLSSLLGGAGRSGGLLGGLAAMAGGTAMLNNGVSDADRAGRVEQGIEDEGLAALMLRAMAQAIRADGQIDEEEHDTLSELMAEGDEADHAALTAALSEPVDAAALARDVPAGQGAQVYAAALTAIDIDTRAEVNYLNQLAQGLSITADEQRMIHEAQGKPV